ncbi:hypothetical protein B7494_g7328 [Chlorociboria aeruginascens]|nr:hypothetical protein B7494_g7328 [Chlorociboria aeruginascens]
MQISITMRTWRWGVRSALCAVRDDNDMKSSRDGVGWELELELSDLDCHRRLTMRRQEDGVSLNKTTRVEKEPSYRVEPNGPGHVYGGAGGAGDEPIDTAP